MWFGFNRDWPVEENNLKSPNPILGNQMMNMDLKFSRRSSDAPWLCAWSTDPLFLMASLFCSLLPFFALSESMLLNCFRFNPKSISRVSGLCFLMLYINYFRVSSCVMSYDEDTINRIPNDFRNMIITNQLLLTHHKFSLFFFHFLFALF